MNTLRTSIDCISNDELMLKELERSDGIYSFIFHELEAPKSKSETSASDQLMLKELERRDDIYSFIFHELEAPKNKSETSAPDQQAQLKRHSCEEKLVAEEQVVVVEQQMSQASCSKMSPATAEPQIPPRVMQQHFQEYLKHWNPPPSLVYDHPQLYAYMANCGFRVRVPPPRFSHVTAPLVRNRQHALKDSPEYKRCGVCLLNIPDLRTLFPCDPDVHAPFAGPQNKPNLSNKYID